MTSMQGSRRALYNRDHRFSAENLSAYIDGELPANERTRVERHLAECGDCRSDMRTLQATVTLMRAVPQRPTPRSFALPASARAVQTRNRRWNMAFGALRGATVTIATLLLLVFAGDAALTSGLVSLPGARTNEAPMAAMATDESAATQALPNAASPAGGEATSDAVQPMIAQAPPSREQPQPEHEDAAKPEAVEAPAPAETARALQPPLETWPGPQGEQGAPAGGASDPTAMGGVGGAGGAGGGGGEAMPTMPRASGVGGGEAEPAAEPTAEPSAEAGVEAASAQELEEPTAEAPAQKVAPPTAQPTAEPTPTEPAPTEPPAIAQAPVAPAPEATLEPTPEALALQAEPESDEAPARGAEADRGAPLTHQPESPWQRIWRAARPAMGLLVGLLLIALAGTIWAGYKRSNT